MLTVDKLRTLVYHLLRTDGNLSHPAMARKLGRLDADNGTQRRRLDQILWLIRIDDPMDRFPAESVARAGREVIGAYNAAYTEVLDERWQASGSLKGTSQ